MVTSISSHTFASPLATPGTRAAGGSASVALQYKLSRCEQQLGDWQACPSRKTPEGKKIIEDLQTQIRNLESRLGSTGGLATAGGGAGMLGRTLDVFA